MAHPNEDLVRRVFDAYSRGIAAVSTGVIFGTGFSPAKAAEAALNASTTAATGIRKDFRSILNSRLSLIRAYEFIIYRIIRNGSSSCPIWSPRVPTTAITHLH
jgi:hypothetical protein